MHAKQCGTTALLTLLVAALLAGCASGVRRAEDTTKRQAYFAGGGKLAKEVTLSMSKNAQTQLSENVKFDQEKLLLTIKRTLDAKGLLARTPDADLPTIEIVVDDIRVRSNFSAVMFGFMAGDDHVNGEVIARDKMGKELQRFQVSASYALGGLAGGQDDARMNWLYETFAQETVNELTGAATEPSAQASAQRSADWVDIKDPNELRALYTNKTFRGDGWVGHFRADGKGILLPRRGDPRPRTWEVKGNDLVCATEGREPAKCYRYQRSTKERNEFVAISVTSGDRLFFTVEDGVPKF